MQLFMWQADIVGVAYFVMDCFDLLGAAPDGHDDDYSDSNSSSFCPGGWIDVIIHSFAHFVMDCFDLLGVVPDAQDDGCWVSCSFIFISPGGWIDVLNHSTARQLEKILFSSIEFDSHPT